MADENPNLEMDDSMAPAPAVGKPSMIGRLNVLLILAAIVAAECILAYFMMPTPTQVVIAADQRAADEQAEADEENTPKPVPVEGYEQDFPGEGDEGTRVEKKLGEPFEVTAYRPESSTTILVRFTLWGTVNEDEAEEFDKTFEERQNRFRGIVSEIIRNAEPADLNDPLLGLIKRKILEKSNRLFGKRYLKTIIIVDPSIVHQ